MRLDVYVAEHGNVTRSAARRLIADGQVQVNGKAITKAGYALRPNDIAAFAMPKVAPSEIIAEEITLDIAYEDTELIVINKTKGMVVHPAAGHASGTLVNALMHHCDGSLSGIGGVARPGIVHRLDKDTSGLLVVAKTDVAHNFLAEQFAKHSVKREYIAIVHGRPNPPTGTVEAALARHKIDRKRMAIDPSGRAAVTHYSTIEHLGNFTLIKANLETGRTHQIRIHMAHIGHPVLADPVYTRSKLTHGLGGQALHARTLGFIHPNGEHMEFEVSPPSCFQKVLDKIRPR